MTPQQQSIDFDAVAEVLSDEARYRSSDPSASKRAALSVKAGTQRARILLALSESPRGLNGFEAQQACGILRQHTATTRMEDLEALGLAYRDGTERPTDSKAMAGVFFVTAKGVEVARSLREGMAA